MGAIPGDGVAVLANDTNADNVLGDDLDVGLCLLLTDGTGLQGLLLDGRCRALLAYLPLTVLWGSVNLLIRKGESARWQCIRYATLLGMGFSATKCPYR